MEGLHCTDSRQNAPPSRNVNLAHFDCWCRPALGESYVRLQVGFKDEFAALIEEMEAESWGIDLNQVGQ